MSPKRRKKRGTGTVKSRTRTTRSRKPARTRRRSARPKKAAGKALHAVSAKKRAAVFHHINRVLEQHGIRGAVAEMHLDADADPLDPCPPGTIRRQVCRRLPTGTIACQELCVPV